MKGDKINDTNLLKSDMRYGNPYKRPTGYMGEPPKIDVNIKYIISGSKKCITIVTCNIVVTQPLLHFMARV